MHDMLFENQSALQLKHLLGYASKLELDLDRFQHELKQHVHSDRVRQNFIRGVKDGVRGTPGLFLNGVRHHGPLDEHELRQILQET
jgi:protein-disulfide isomerase